MGKVARFSAQMATGPSMKTAILSKMASTSQVKLRVATAVGTAARWGAEDESARRTHLPPAARWATKTHVNLTPAMICQLVRNVMYFARKDG